jgi:hypothetical protein
LFLVVAKHLKDDGLGLDVLHKRLGNLYRDLIDHSKKKKNEVGYHASPLTRPATTGRLQGNTTQQSVIHDSFMAIS